MKRNGLLWILLAAVVGAPASHAGAAVAWSVTIGNAPPPPVVVFRQEPRVVVVPGSTVYVLHRDHDCDYDVFRYGVYWYIFSDGYWYRARSYRGPFVAVGARYVPAAIVNVPSKYWRHPHGGPPGQMKKQSAYAVGKDKGKRKP